MNASVPSSAVLVRALSDLLEADPGVVLLVEGDGPVVDALRPRFADRIVALPVADRAAVALAVGLAWGGRRPIVEVSSTGRLPALVEVLTEAARTPAGFTCGLVLRVPLGDEAGRVDAPALDLLASIPGLTVVAGRDPGRVAALLRTAVRADRPVVVLEPRATLRATPTDGDAVLGRADVLRDGAHVALVAHGAGVEAALDAADALAAEGVEATVLDLVTLAPLDVAALGAALARTGRLVVVAPDAEAAFAARVVAAASAAGFWSQEAPPRTAAPARDVVVAAARAVLES